MCFTNGLLIGLKVLVTWQITFIRAPTTQLLRKSNRFSLCHKTALSRLSPKTSVDYRNIKSSVEDEGTWENLHFFKFSTAKPLRMFLFGHTQPFPSVYSVARFWEKFQFLGIWGVKSEKKISPLGSPKSPENLRNLNLEEVCILCACENESRDRVLQPLGNFGIKHKK